MTVENHINAMKTFFDKAVQQRILWKTRVSSGFLVTVGKINATFGVKAKGLLANVFLRMLGPIGLAKTATRAKTVIAFLVKCQFLFKHNGMKGLVIYLKASQVLLQQSLGGFRLRDLTELKCRPSRNRMGLPRWIPASDRALIRAGNAKLARFHMTLFALFRVLEFPGTLKLKTITDPFKGDMSPGSVYWRVVRWAPTFAKMLLRHSAEHKILPLELRGVDPRPILKSAPGSSGEQISTTPWVLVTQAFNLKRLGLADCIEYFIKYFDKGTKIPSPGLMGVWTGAVNLPLVMPSLNHLVGKLGFKEEPAGKVRVFAMADAWTQWVLEPFHSWLFDILRPIEMDGTFDQLRPIKAKAGSVHAAYSLDLSAATDRLPISIQAELFSHLVHKDFAVQWMRLLVGRSYMAHSDKYHISQELRYAVGQPMGALSSWASLAITHHFIVQCAAWDAGVTPAGSWFKEYAVLGDDLVIFDYKVKRHYLMIVNAIGVECGIAKSLLSPSGTAIEFAKRTFWKGVDISPIPLTEFISANLTLSDAISFAKKYNLSFPGLLKTLGYGYRVVTGYQRHVGSLNSRVRALLFAYELPQTEEQVREYFSRGNPLLKPEVLELVLKEFKSMVQGRYKDTITRRLNALPNPATLIKDEGERTLEILMNRIYYAGFLQTWLDKVLPGADQKSISTVVRPWILGMFGLRPKGFEISQDNTSVAQVPAALFSKIEGDIRLWRLSIERIVRLVAVKPLTSFRADARKLLRYEIDAISFARTMESTYTHLMTVHRLMSKAGSSRAPLFREEEQLKWGSDPVQMRFWRDWTTSILRVLKTTSLKAQGDNSSSKAQ